MNDKRPSQSNQPEGRQANKVVRIVPARPDGPIQRESVHPDIDEAAVERLVRHFYGRIREDAFLGPIFEDAIGPDWEPHLRRLTDFWSSVVMMSGRYKGDPAAAHRALPPLTEAHFDRWLALFRESAREVSPPGTAPIFIDRAERIAASLARAVKAT